MAMLAGPRRKQKVINLRAKNSVWSNDQNKFGQRMLEKMGWSAGKGLGANENGIVEHVIAKYKNDEKGLGFEDKNDQWTKHEDDFNALLSNLSQASGGEEKLHSGISLEDKSKKSKARVHYHKFTRGKDLTRYSEKDLANIFGKKSLKDEKKNTELILKEDVKTTGQIFTEKGSMEDYFKSKLASLKTKSKLLTCESTVAENSDYVFKGFSMDLQYNDNDSLNDNDLNKHEANNIVLHEETAVLSKKVKNKKSKKKKNKCTNEAEFEEAIVCNDITILKNVDDGSEGDSKAKSKKKKNKYKNESELEETIVCDDSTLLNTVEDNRSKDGNKSKSKKSKRKNKDPNLNECHVVSSEFQDDQLEEHNYIPKKKKKKKIKHSEM